MKKQKPAKAIKIYDEHYELLCRIARMEGRFKSFIVGKSLELYHKTNFKKRNY